MLRRTNSRRNSPVLRQVPTIEQCRLWWSSRICARRFGPAGLVTMFAAGDGMSATDNDSRARPSGRHARTDELPWSAIVIRYIHTDIATVAHPGENEKVSHNVPGRQRSG